MRTGLAPPCAGMMGLSKPTENTGGTKPVAHNDTVFAQVLKLVPRHEFESLARKHKSGRMSRSMTRWGQFVAMGMAQLTGRCSLRDIVSNLAAQSCKLYHLGVGVVTRSSLARVNAEKPWEMYEELHGRLLGRCQAKAPGHDAPWRQVQRQVVLCSIGFDHRSSTLAAENAQLGGPEPMSSPGNPVRYAKKHCCPTGGLAHPVLV